MAWAENIVNIFPAAFLFIAPPCAAAAVGVLALFCRRRGWAIWAWLLILGLSCGMLTFHKDGGAGTAFGYGCLLFVFLLLLSAGAFFRRMPEKKRSGDQKTADKKGGQKADELTASDPVLTGMPSPEAVLPQNTDPSPAPAAAGVQLEHVFSVLKKLQGMKLSAGDRLETDVIRNMLNVYRAKGVLSAEETRALNNYLATLLKLMSKYSV